MVLVTGLGNPGHQYEKTRHNIGFLALDFLASHFKFSLNLPQFNAIYAKVALFQRQIFFIKPQTYMNHSGKAVKSFVDFYKILPENIIIIHDDVDLPLGDIRLKTKGGAAGHHGVESIIESLGTEDFKRFRFGVGRPIHPDIEISDYVLSPLQPEVLKTFYTSMETLPPLLEKVLAGLKHP